jgi:hypothetical protein
LQCGDLNARLMESVAWTGPRQRPAMATKGELRRYENGAYLRVDS